MDDEFNKVNISNLTADEVSSYVEIKDETLNDKNCDENNGLETKVTVKRKSLEMSSLITKLTSGFMVTALAAFTLVIPGMASSSSVDVSLEFMDATVTDTTISCGVKISDYTVADFTLVLKNGFTKRTYDVNDSEVEWFIEGLKPNMNYSLEVTIPGSFGSTKTLSKMDVKTLSEKEYKTTKFNDIKTECRCHIDGYFYFTMDFVDYTGTYSNFGAYLEDSDGNISKCQFNDDYHSEQKILVKDVFPITASSATLVVFCDKLEDGITTEIEAYRITNISI